jgi:hypothetical protein
MARDREWTFLCQFGEWNKFLFYLFIFCLSPRKSGDGGFELVTSS